MLSVISGKILGDFTVDPKTGHYWSMIEQTPQNNYDVTLLDVPEGAETLLLENEPITVRGRVQGLIAPTVLYKEGTFRLPSDG